MQITASQVNELRQKTGAGMMDCKKALTEANGDYEKAIDCLTLLILYTHNSNDSIAIFKYLGFSYGMLGRIDRAKENFSNALNKLPDLQIDTLECPPNISIIFNQVKLERKIAKIDTATPVKKVEVVQKKNPFVPVLLLTMAVVSAGAGSEVSQ